MIYFDNSATTALSLEAKEAMILAMDNFANPSSLHLQGQKASKILTNARENIGRSLGLNTISKGEIVFTSGGTESNNTAIIGTAYAKKRRISNRIITTDSEHPSVENTLKRLECDGFEVIRISTKDGQLDFDSYEKALDVPPLLVTMMMVNNETGAVYDVEKAFRMAKENCKDTVTHCDAVQGYLKCKFTPKSICADLISASSHKIHGPKGIGFLYINPEMLKAKKIIPLVCGGEQENSFRPGTENTVGIAGFSAAAKYGYDNFDSNISKMEEVRNCIINELSDSEAVINLPKDRTAPHILSIRLPDIKSETMLHYLSGCDICVSSGSACSSHSKKSSRALIAFGLLNKQADCTIRVSLCEYNTVNEAHEFCETLKKGMNTLIRIK